MFAFSIVLFYIGIVAVIIASVNFRNRMIMQKHAWGGITLPFLAAGILTILISIVMIFIHYPMF